MLGGVKTAKACGIDVPGRDEIWQWISSHEEGELFRADDFLSSRPHLSDDFSALRGHDYMHVSDGWLVGIVETEYLRRMPRLEVGMRAYSNLRGCRLVETGDWVAWRRKIKQWEPLLGHRFYSDGADELLAYGRYMTVRIINAPDWLRMEDETSRLLRAFHDIPEKDFDEAMRRATKESGLDEHGLLSICARAREIGALMAEERNLWPWLRCPVSIADSMEAWIDRDRMEKAG